MRNKRFASEIGGLRRIEVIALFTWLVYGSWMLWRIVVSAGRLVSPPWVG